MSLYDQIEEYTRSILSTYAPVKLREVPKTVHEPVFGSSIFEPHEVALLDTPFGQRLRHIRQTGAASFVYPSANHNRLEHSLGVAVAAGKVAESLRRESEGHRLVDDATLMALRCAAILHDTGVGPFSHVTEGIFNEFPEIKLIRAQNPGKFDPDKPHEMLAYLIIKSHSFKDFFANQIVKEYRLPQIDPEQLADMIIGQMDDPDLKGWQADVINGAFDADKLDYLQRDCYFTGLRMGIDLDRLLSNIWVESKRNEPRRLKVMTSGASTLEQILFAKVQLFSAIYHHHKVRAAECMIRAIFEILEDNPSYQICGRRMNRAVDFLELTDADILSTHDKPGELRSYIQRLINRDLLKRALVISWDTVEKPEQHAGYAELKALAEPARYSDVKDLRRMLVEALNNKYSLHEIWIDFPRSPRLREPSQAIIQDPKGAPLFLSDVFPVDKWLTAYSNVKWKGYVFCPADPGVRHEVGKKAAELLSDIYNITFTPRAFELAKID